MAAVEWIGSRCDLHQGCELTLRLNWYWANYPRIRSERLAQEFRVLVRNREMQRVCKEHEEYKEYDSKRSNRRRERKHLWSSAIWATRRDSSEQADATCAAHRLHQTSTDCALPPTPAAHMHIAHHSIHDFEQWASWQSTISHSNLITETYVHVIWNRGKCRKKGFQGFSRAIGVSASPEPKKQNTFYDRHWPPGRHPNKQEENYHLANDSQTLAFEFLWNSVPQSNPNRSSNLCLNCFLDLE